MQHHPEIRAYQLKGTNRRYYAIQITEKSTVEVARLVGGEPIQRGELFAVKDIDGNVALSVEMGTWLVLQTAEVGKSVAIAGTRDDLATLSNAAFLERFEEVKAPVDNGPSLFSLFAERLEKQFDELKANGTLTPNSSDEDIHNLLAEALTGVDENPKAMITAALACLLIDDRGEFTPGELIEVSQADA